MLMIKHIRLPRSVSLITLNLWQAQTSRRVRGLASVWGAGEGRRVPGSSPARLSRLRRSCRSANESLLAGRSRDDYYWKTWVNTAIFNWASKVIRDNIRDYIGFSFPRSVIGVENSRHLLNHSDTKLKPILTCMVTNGFTLSSHWLIGFGFTTFNWKALYYH